VLEYQMTGLPAICYSTPYGRSLILRCCVVSTIQSLNRCTGSNVRLSFDFSQMSLENFKSIDKLSSYLVVHNSYIMDSLNIDLRG
jgi:hypothetical protein